MSEPLEDGFLPDALKDALGQARSIGVITGAGVSAESGIQTYRGGGGLYDDPDEGDRTVEALTFHTLETNPDLTWRTVGGLARQVTGAQPNDAHRAIARLEESAERFVLLTQNVDGLHQRAGSRNVIDIHGSINKTLCMSCDAEGELSFEALAALVQSPRCQSCQGLLRPNAVLFGELLPIEKTLRLRRELHDDVPDIVISAGTSALFPYIVEPLHVAVRLGKFTVDINPEETALSEIAAVHLKGPAGHFFPAIADVYCCS